MRTGLAILAALLLADTVAARPNLPRAEPYLRGGGQWKTILSAPPAPGSPAGRADRAAYEAAAAAAGGPQWMAATAQLRLDTNEVLGDFACAMGRGITRDGAPATRRLIARLARDSAIEAKAAKTYFRRDRPFVGDPRARTCDTRTVENPDALGYSYPSGHATNGRLWARALALAWPASGKPVAAYGRSLGENRIACRVHYPSDIAAGRKLADALFDQIAASSDFRADLAAAKAELVAAGPAQGCSS